jgi:hypothetical protein
MSAGRISTRSIFMGPVSHLDGAFGTGDLQLRKITFRRIPVGRQRGGG